MANKTAKHAKKTPDPNARKLIGKKVYYIGALSCPICGKRQKRGMASQYQDKFYCSEDCVTKVVAYGN